MSGVSVCQNLIKMRYFCHLIFYINGDVCSERNHSLLIIVIRSEGTIVAIMPLYIQPIRKGFALIKNINFLVLVRESKKI